MTDPTHETDDPGTRRTRSVVAAELADVERHLREVPPHSGGGLERLAARRSELQRELTAFTVHPDVTRRTP